MHSRGKIVLLWLDSVKLLYKKVRKQDVILRVLIVQFFVWAQRANLSDKMKHCENICWKMKFIDQEQTFTKYTLNKTATLMGAVGMSGGITSRLSRWSRDIQTWHWLQDKATCPPFIYVIYCSYSNSFVISDTFGVLTILRGNNVKHQAFRLLIPHWLLFYKY